MVEGSEISYSSFTITKSLVTEFGVISFWGKAYMTRALTPIVWSVKLEINVYRNIVLYKIMWRYVFYIVLTYESSVRFCIFMSMKEVVKGQRIWNHWRNWLEVMLNQSWAVKDPKIGIFVHSICGGNIDNSCTRDIVSLVWY